MKHGLRCRLSRILADGFTVAVQGVVTHLILNVISNESSAGFFRKLQQFENNYYVQKYYFTIINSYSMFYIIFFTYIQKYRVD